MKVTGQAVVVGHDGSERGRDAIALADLLAAALGARLVIVTVYPVVDPDLRAAAEAQLRAIEEETFAAAAETIAVADPSPADALARLATRAGAALLVVGATHRSRPGRVLIGGVARRLAQASPCALAIAPNGFATEPRRLRVVGAAFDMSAESYDAVRFAADTAAALGAVVRIVAVVPRAARHFADVGQPGAFAGPEASPQARLQQALVRVRASLPERLRAEGHLLQGDPAEQLIAEAGNGIDLLVMGSRGHGRVGRVLLGSVSLPVMEGAPCGVVVVPRGTGAGRREPVAQDRRLGGVP